MGGPRSWACALLGWLARMAPAGLRDWAEAMRGEAEAVEGEWEALWWALGGAAVVLRRAAFEWMTGVKSERERRRMVMGKKAGWLVLGAVGAVALSLAGFGFLSLMAASFPGSIRNAGLAHLVGVIIVPLTICLVSAVWLWGRVRPAAVGILLSAGLMSAHIVVYYAHLHH